MDHKEAKEAKDAASDLADHVLQPIWNEMQEDMMTRLDKITIEDLCRRATDLGIERVSDTKLDFTI
jgi:Rrf2 family iron-sulfur cluster assembly transcriptional regulator